MSSRLSAFSYIQGSGVDYWCIDQVTTLSNLIQNIQDDRYVDTSRICLDTIRYTDPEKDSLGVVIRGLSLGDGKIEIYNRGNIADCVSGIQGRIALIYEYYGERRTVDLSEIKNITQGNTIDRKTLNDVPENPSQKIEAIKTPTQVQKIPVSQ